MEKKGRRRVGDWRRPVGETVGEDGWISGPPFAFGQPVAIPALSSWPLKVFFLEKHYVPRKKTLPSLSPSVTGLELN